MKETGEGQVIDEVEESSEIEELDTTVIFQGRTFELSEPSTGVVMRILNVSGSLGIRSEGAASRMMAKPGNRAVMFGMMAVMTQNDLVRLGSAVFQFEDDKAGRKWIKEAGLRVSPIVKALFLNISLSEDLVESLDSFLAGLGQMEGTLEAVTTLFKSDDEESKESEKSEEPDPSAG